MYSTLEHNINLREMTAMQAMRDWTAGSHIHNAKCVEFSVSTEIIFKFLNPVPLNLIIPSSTHNQAKQEF